MPAAKCTSARAHGAAPESQLIIVQASKGVVTPSPESYVDVYTVSTDNLTAPCDRYMVMLSAFVPVSIQT